MDTDTKITAADTNTKRNPHLNSFVRNVMRKSAIHAVPYNVKNVTIGYTKNVPTTTSRITTTTHGNVLSAETMIMMTQIRAPPRRQVPCESHECLIYICIMSLVSCTLSHGTFICVNFTRGLYREEYWTFILRTSGSRTFSTNDLSRLKLLFSEGTRELYEWILESDQCLLELYEWILLYGECSYYMANASSNLAKGSSISRWLDGISR